MTRAKPFVIVAAVPLMLLGIDRALSEATGCNKGEPAADCILRQELAKIAKKEGYKSLTLPSPAKPSVDIGITGTGGERAKGSVEKFNLEQKLDKLDKLDQVK